MGAPDHNQPRIHLILRGYLLGPISPFKGLQQGVKQLGYHPKGTSIFPMNGGDLYPNDPYIQLGVTVSYGGMRVARI